MNKLSSLQALLYSSRHSIYCFSETWLSDHILDKEIIPSMYRKDRSTRGGGVLIAVRESITSTFVSTQDDLKYSQ